MFDYFTDKASVETIKNMSISITFCICSNCIIEVLKIVMICVYV